MSSIKSPVGPQPPSVYWRRRLLLLLGLVVVVVVIVLIIVQPGRDATPSADDTTTPGAGTSESPSAPAEETNADGTCAPSSVAVVPITDATSYGPEQAVQISMSITNTGSEACEFDVGPAAQLLVITSGSDELWKSSDCAAPADPNVITLEPGAAQTTTPITWARERSSADTCDPEAQRPSVYVAGATYRLTASVGEATAAEPVAFVLQ